MNSTGSPDHGSNVDGICEPVGETTETALEPTNREGKDDPPCLESSSCGCVLPESSRGEASSSKKDAETTSGDSSSESCDGEEERLSVTNLYRLMTQGANPRDVLKRMLDIPERDLSMLEECTDRDVWRLLFETVSRRQKLRQYNTLADAVDLIEKSNKIVVLTGAGISVSCGIPDFRSADGLYAQLKKQFPQLQDPSHIFNIFFFKNDPQPFFTFAKELYPGKFQPSITHKFVRALEIHGKLLRNYSQNIDTLEKVCGIQNTLLCHGSFAQATCVACGHQVDAETIRSDVFEGRIPKCIQCVEPGPSSIYKPNIVFFGEDLPAEYYQSVERDKEECDLLIVIGTSLKVHPVAAIPRNFHSIPQILINRESVPDHLFDIELLGDADVITQHLSHLLQWTDHLPPKSTLLHQISKEDALDQYKKARNPDPMTPEDFDRYVLRSMFESRNYGAWLPDSNDSFMFFSPNRYIFPGAMVLEKDRSTGIRRLTEPDTGMSNSEESDD